MLIKISRCLLLFFSITLIIGHSLVLAGEAGPTDAQLQELYKSVADIIKAEEAFSTQHKSYASLPYTLTQAEIDRFESTLGIKVPGLDSPFVYGVYYTPAEIFVRVRSHPADPADGGWWILCSIPLEGEQKGVWTIYAFNPWSAFLKPPANTRLEYKFAEELTVKD